MQSDTDTNNTDGAALLPVTPDACPFCGGEGLPHRVATGWRVSCKNCDAQPRPGFPSDNEAEAIAAWNTRAPLRATQEDAERSGVGVAVQMVSHDEMAEHPAAILARALSTPTTSTPQRQEYDGEALLRAVCDAQNASPYRGWNLTALNKAVDKIREYLGLPSIRELNPDIAAMQDHASANKDALSAALAHPAQAREEMTAQTVDKNERLITQVEKLIAAIDFEVPAIREGVNVARRLDILTVVANEARAALSSDKGEDL